MPFVIFLWIQSILLNKHCRENKGISCGVGEFLWYKENFRCVRDKHWYTEEMWGGGQEGWAVQNTALGNCTPSCKPFPVWTGRTLLPAVCFSTEWWVSSCLGCGHTVHSSYTHTPRWKQNSVGAAGQTLVRECICTERQRKMHVILFLQ